MSNVSDVERDTQNRVVKLLQTSLDYEYLGNWEKRPNNRNIEAEYLRAWLKSRSIADDLIKQALSELDKHNALDDGNNLYSPNESIYNLLRYGLKLKSSTSDHHQTVYLIDWENPFNNHFAFAEEVTLKGRADKRPDLVFYVNGIALGVLELKRAKVGIEEGIRQNLDNQKQDFIRSFFTTVQLVMAGNDSQGLAYGTIETPEKYYLTWKEENPDYNPKVDNKDQQYLPQYNCESASSVLDCALLRLLNKERFIELLHNFIVFDKGAKKLCRHNQYFGVKAAQKRIASREGGIIWHTQGSGKSLTMVWLAKWIRETQENSRVLIITDRTELDEQIEGVFQGVKENIYRCKSGRDLAKVLNESTESLICSLVHKFGAGEEGSESQNKAFVEDLLKAVPSDFSAKGNIFVFIDECHRTHKESGKLHQAMKQLLPHALFIGFTGTPLLKADKKSSVETFGSYIHTYKFDQAVTDKVVLDLRYEARDIDQYITNKAKIDQWFESKTNGLSSIAKARVKQKWSNMQSVLSSESRLQQIVNDILMDMLPEGRPRLADGSGNAMLVCSSVYQACKVYELFSDTELAGKCAIITSYQPTNSSIKGEETGEGKTEELRKYEIYRKMLARYFNQPEDEAAKRVSEFEIKVKEQFKKQPAQMRLLIVVDKLLTGFDAPSATYLYIDKKMQDHGLFQAICRVNRLDGDSKEYGYIIDYKDLFQNIEGAMTDYTEGAFEGYDKEDISGLLKNRVQQAKAHLEESLEEIRALCEPVKLPRDINDYIEYFVSNNTLDKTLAIQNEPKRVALYKLSGALMRAYAGIANDLTEAGYSAQQAEALKQEVKHYFDAREAVKLASGDYSDAKALEPAMRHIFDQYIRANDSELIASFDKKGLLEVLVDSGITALKSQLPKTLRSEASMAETIENNIRKVIIDTHAINPKYYDKLSELLDELIQLRLTQAQDYRSYLEKVKALAEQTINRPNEQDYPVSLTSNAMRNLYDNLNRDEALVLSINEAVLTTKRAQWVGHKMKEKQVRIAVGEVVGKEYSKLDELMELIKKQYEYH
ncbi:MAG: HsdR family type I site-specific deoxyribonuclease [Thiothrix sp.]|nr:MAG: HsdR family type I site-specific deoxyribonuclease [Thiothrix sp.]